MARLQIALLVAISFAAQARGEDIQVRVAKQRPPCFIGQPAVIRFTVEGFEQGPEPTVEAEQIPEGLRTRTVTGNPRVISGHSNINGRITRYAAVTYTINFVVTSDQPGEYTIGPFVLRQGAKEARVQAISMTFEAIPEDPDSQIRLVLPEGNIYPDQRVPVQIQWTYSGDVSDVRDISVHSPIFDLFRFGPPPPARRGQVRMTIETEDGPMPLAADVRRQQRDGQEVLVITATRTLIPNRIGQFDLAPITATLMKRTHSSGGRRESGRSAFGNSLLDEFFGGSSQPPALYRVIGKPQTLIVKPFPQEGRPESFAGAVGEGFSIEVAADRTVVRAGDPIGLTIALRGKGNLDTASLPPLSADGGLNPGQFRLPEGETPGKMADGVKQFQVSVRVTDDSVIEIPKLAYSWFDPQTEMYRTAHSKPIALRVMPAQVVSASDVVTGSAQSASPTSPQPGEPEGEPAQVASLSPKTPAFSLSGADLAIEPLAGVVLRDEGDWRRTLLWQLALYGGGFALVIAAAFERRRHDIDPVILARRKTVRVQRDKIAHAARLPQKEAAAEIAEALRCLVAERPDVARAEAQAVIAACESIVFAPDLSDAGTLDPSLIEQAKTLAHQFTA